MSTAIFAAAGVGKRYRTGQERPFRDFVRRSAAPSSWALRDVDVEVEAGEVVAVVGRNGAGKSTLLKVAAGVTVPTIGTVTRPQRIAPLIEVGAGFHPELSGRENVHVNGRLLGLTRREIDAAFDEIVGFAGLEHAIDRPVRQYSSGMFMRLGFSVAIHTRPELLIVDEVLAVGDLPFQVKCLDRIRELRADGVGVLFVSHNIAAVLNLATRAVLLESGTMRSSGDVNEVVGAYHTLLGEIANKGEVGEDSPPTGELVLDAIELLDAAGDARDLWDPGDRATLRCVLRAASDCPQGVVAVRVSKEGAGTVALWHAVEGPFTPALRAGEHVETKLQLDLNLAEGGYLLDFGVARRDFTADMVKHLGVMRIGVGVRKGASGIADLAPSLEVRST